MYISIFFTIVRNTIAVLLLPADLSAFRSERRLFLHPAKCFAGAVFFFRHQLTALLSLKEIVVEGLPCSDWSLGLSLHEHPLYSALRTYVFGRSLFLSSNTDMLLFHLMPSLRFFYFRTTQLALSSYYLGARL